MNTSSTGSSTPLMTCATIMIPNRSTLGRTTTTAESSVIAVTIPRYAGASAQLLSCPRSQPNASHTALDVMPGSTHAAKKLAPTRPAPKSTSA